ncbi:MAG: helix-turn-helix domain-containing protein [Myxococcota bacterium]
MKKRSRSAEIGVSSGNVFADLGFENAEEELAKARLTAAIARAIKSRRFKNQREAAEVLGIDQPKISKLLRGHFAEYSVGRLLTFLTRLGYNVEIKVANRPHVRKPGHLDVANTGA